MLLPSELTEISIRDGLARHARLLIFPREEKFYWTGQYETGVQMAIQRFLHPGDTFWDIGSHVGFFAIIGSRAVGPTGRVHAFEPYPPSVDRLRQHVALNDLRNVVVHAEAMAADPGPMLLHANVASLMWTLVPSMGREAGIDVQCTTLSIAARELGVPQVIKIDAEGAEVDILRGGLDILASDQSPALVIEFSDEALLADGKVVLHAHSFTRLSDRHWLVLPPRRLAGTD